MAEQLDSTQEIPFPNGKPYLPGCGEFGIKTLILLLFWNLVFVPMMFSIYGFLGSKGGETPEIRALIAILWACGNGFVVRQLAKKGHCHSEVGLLLAAAAGGIWSLYVSWTAWLYFFWGQQKFIFNPVEISRAMQYLADVGIWGIGKERISTQEHYFAWAAEAALFIFLPAAFCWNSIRSIPFCKRCGRNLTSFFSLELAQPEEIGQLERVLKTGDYRILFELPPRSNSYYLQVEFLKCPDCETELLLRVSQCADVPGSFTKIRQHKKVLYCGTCTDSFLRRFRTPSAETP